MSHLWEGCRMYILILFEKSISIEWLLSLYFFNFSVLQRNSVHFVHNFQASCHYTVLAFIATWSTKNYIHYKYSLKKALVFCMSAWLFDRQCFYDIVAILVAQIQGPCFGYFYTFFASRCMKWLKFSLDSHASQIEEYHLVWNNWDHKRTMIGPC